MKNAILFISIFLMVILSPVMVDGAILNTTGIEWENGRTDMPFFDTSLNFDRQPFMEHNNNIYSLSYNEIRSVWNSSDGINWENINPSPPYEVVSEFPQFSYNGSLYIVGGQYLDQNYLATDNLGRENCNAQVNSNCFHASDDVWVSDNDGLTWNNIGNNNIGRIRAMAYITFNNKMWIFNPENETSPGQFQTLQPNRVFTSTDGINWVEESIVVISPFTDAVQFQKVTTNGTHLISAKPSSDVIFISSDGIIWYDEFKSQTISCNAPYTLAVEDQLFCLSGNAVYTSPIEGGDPWVQIYNDTDTYLPREDFQVIDFNNKLWVFLGKQDIPPNELNQNNLLPPEGKMDSWYSHITNTSQEPPDVNPPIVDIQQRTDGNGEYSDQKDTMEFTLSVTDNRGLDNVTFDYQCNIAGDLSVTVDLQRNLSYYERKIFDIDPLDLNLAESCNIDGIAFDEYGNNATSGESRTPTSDTTGDYNDLEPPEIFILLINNLPILNDLNLYTYDLSTVPTPGYHEVNFTINTKDNTDIQDNRLLITHINEITKEVNTEIRDYHNNETNVQDYNITDNLNLTADGHYHLEFLASEPKLKTPDICAFENSQNLLIPSCNYGQNSFDFVVLDDITLNPNEPYDVVPPNIGYLNITDTEGQYSGKEYIQVGVFLNDSMDVPGNNGWVKDITIQLTYPDGTVESRIFTNTQKDLQYMEAITNFTTLDAGTYTLTAFGRDNYHNTNITTPNRYFILVGDVEPPTVDFIPETTEDGLRTNNDNIEANLSATDNFGVDTLGIRLIYPNGTTETQYSTDNPFYYNWDNLDEGAYVFHGFANDTSGNINTTETHTVMIASTSPLDQTAPTVEFVDPSTSEGIHVQNYIEGNVTAEDNLLGSGIAQVRIHLTHPNGTVETYTTTNETIYHNYTNLDTSGGSFILRADAIDNDDNIESTEARSIRLNDTENPVIKFVDPTPGFGVYLSQDFIPVNLTGTDSTNISRILSHIHDENFTTIAEHETNSSPNYFVHMNLTDGIYYAHGEAYDVFNNTAETQERLITLDTIAPIINIHNPIGTFTNPGDAEEDIPLNLSVDDVNPGSIIYNIDGGSNTTYNTESSITLTAGTYTINVYATDLAGNTNSTSSEFTVEEPLTPTTTTVGGNTLPSLEEEKPVKPTGFFAGLTNGEIAFWVGLALLILYISWRLYKKYWPIFIRWVKNG